MDYNNLSDEEIKAQFPGLYQQMNEYVAKMVQGMSTEELIKAAEKMQGSSVSGSSIRDANGGLIGSINPQSDNEFGVEDIDDELLQELFSGIGIGEDGEISRTQGVKEQVRDIIDGLKK